MYFSAKTTVKTSAKLSSLVNDNPLLLLMLQHFGVDFRMGDFTVSQLCAQYEISENLFISITNLYNGFPAKVDMSFSKNDLLQVVDFLKNSHAYYRFDKYPQISSYIHQLQQNHPEKEIKMLEKFFNEYFTEVIEHLDYEDNVAFPYFIELLKKEKSPDIRVLYSSKEYSDHHSDIELKLQDLKNLLLKYVKINGDLNLRRKLFFALYELEFDLYIHSLIEETILIPSGTRIEKG